MASRFGKLLVREKKSKLKSDIAFTVNAVFDSAFIASAVLTTTYFRERNDQTG